MFKFDDVVAKLEDPFVVDYNGHEDGPDDDRGLPEGVIYLMNLDPDMVYEPVAEINWDSESPTVVFVDDEREYSLTTINEYDGEFTKEAKEILDCFK